MSSPKSIIRLWVEWDVGQDGVVFYTVEDALKWLKQSLIDCGIEYSLDHLIEAGLCGCEEIPIRRM